MVSKVFMICDSYESGYGKGLDASKFKDGSHIEGEEEREAYVIGYNAGFRKRVFGADSVTIDNENGSKTEIVLLADKD